MKKMIVILWSFTFILSYLNVVSAENLELKEVSDLVVETFLDELNTNLELKGATPLYDGSDEINGYWYHLEDTNKEGYMIVYNWKGQLIVTEYSLEEDLDIDTTDKIYYDGLLSYYYESNNSLKNERDMSSTNKNNIYIAPELNLEKSISNVTAIENSGTRSSARVSQSWLSHSIPLINQGDINSSYKWSLCAQTASAMLIEYYDRYVNGYNALATNSGVNLALEIYQNHMGLTGGVTTLNGLRNGLLSYISSKGFSGSVSVYECTETNYTMPSNYINTIYSDIMNDRPAIVIIGCNADQANGESFPCTVGVDCSRFLHALTVTGTYSIGNNDYLDVADPDGGVTRTLLWDTYDYPGAPSAIYAAARVIINR